MTATEAPAAPEETAAPLGRTARFAVLVAVVEVVAIVLMYRPEANRFLREMRGAGPRRPRNVW